MNERPFRLTLIVLGHGVFLALLVLAWKHTLLRSTFGDTAFQVFKWVSQPGLDIEAHRYTAAVPQICVKAAMYFGPSLSTLLIIASLAHVLVGYGVFLLCAHGWRAPVSALACAMATVLCTRLTFYSPVLEANYLLCLPFLLLGYLEARARALAPAHADTPAPSHPRTLFTALLLLLIPLVVHPTGWMVMLFCIVFAFALKWTGRGSTIVLVLATLLWPVLSRWILPPTGYELALYDGVLQGLGNFGDLAGWGSWRHLSMHTFSASTTYLPALLVLLAVLVCWTVSRRYILAGLTLGGALAFILVYLITFHKGDAAVMQDRGILPVATIIALSASALVARVATPPMRMAALVLATAVLFIKLRDVSFASRPFAEQYRATGTLIAQAQAQGVRRGLVDPDLLRDRGIQAGWAFPVEILLRSAAPGSRYGIVLVDANNPPPAAALANGDLWLLDRAWDVDANGNAIFDRSTSPYVRIAPR